MKRDITEHAKMEAQLRQAQKMEALGALAAGIAHDFNNILSAVMGYTELTLADLPPDIEIQQDLKADIPAVLADPAEMHQVVMNLCTNAYHAMEEKGGVLKVTLSNTPLSPTTIPEGRQLPPGRYVCLKIADTGCGIEENARQRIFDPFYTTKPKGKGAGMGLTIVHGIVRSHHGGIVLASKPGEGTSFKIFLPVYAQAAPAAPKAIPSVPRGNGEHVLLVDDEASVLNMGTMLLERLGYTVSACPSPAEAREIFRADPQNYDVLVTDGAMPHMSGIALATEISAIRPGMPMILLTGLSTDELGAKAAAAGIDRVVSKPVSLYELASALRHAIESENRS